MVIDYMLVVETSEEMEVIFNAYEQAQGKVRKSWIKQILFDPSEEAGRK